MTERNDDPTTHRRAAGPPPNAWLYRRLSIGMAPPLAALVLFLAGAQIAAAVLLIVGAAVAAPFLVAPVLVLAERARQRELLRGASR